MREEDIFQQDNLVHESQTEKNPSEERPEKGHEEPSSVDNRNEEDESIGIEDSQDRFQL